MKKKKVILKHFLIARDRGAMVVDFLDSSIGDIHWKSPFLRPVQDRELESMMLFLDELFTAIILQDVRKQTAMVSFKRSWFPYQGIL